MAPYGPEDAAIPIVQAFDPVPIEYASVRTHAGVFDAAHRATLELTGADRVAFLNRMLTQELKDATPFTQRRAFWLNRKGRIDADLRVILLPERVLLDVDVFAAERARSGLEAFIIADDVAIRDVTAAHHRLSLHGPAAAAILSRLSTPVAGASVADIRPGQVAVVSLAGAEVVVDRHDWTGQTGGAAGLELLVPAAACVAVYEAISTPWSARDGDGQRDGRGGVTPGTALARRIGWHALNIARIEAGEPLYLTDFGPDSLPAETGEATLNDRVSFKKGCYLGQEVVARMHALGHPKQQLVGLKIRDVRLTPHAGVADTGEGMGSDAYTPQAVTGTPVLSADAPDAPVVGAVTSSCVSPLLGSSSVALAMIKWASSTPGTEVFLGVDGARLPAVVAGPGRLVG
jgi:folate-binding protein YgfZ